MDGARAVVVIVLSTRRCGELRRRPWIADIADVTNRQLWRDQCLLLVDCVAKVAENDLWNCILKKMNRGGCAFEVPLAVIRSPYRQAQAA
jgi:hypothetical protein